MASVKPLTDLTLRDLWREVKGFYTKLLTLPKLGMHPKVCDRAKLGR